MHHAHVYCLFIRQTSKQTQANKQNKTNAKSIVYLSCYNYEKSAVVLPIPIPPSTPITHSSTSSQPHSGTSMAKARSSSA